MTDDVVYDDSWRAFPDLHFDLREVPYVHASEPKAAFWWGGGGTHTGVLDPPGLKATGKRMELDGADFHEYRDGKVVRLRVVFDVADSMRQLGVLPPTGGTQERMLARITNLRGKLPGGA